MGRKKIWFFILTFSLLNLLSCGQKGPLYLPDAIPTSTQTK